jgi:hypothetical protein
MRTTRLISLAAALGIAALLVLIALSSLQMSLMAGLRATVDTRWGVTTMVDLYLGLLVVAGWIGYRERSIPRTLAWLVGLCLLGNLITLVYLLIASLRARSVEDLFRPVPQ